MRTGGIPDGDTRPGQRRAGEKAAYSSAEKAGRLLRQRHRALRDAMTEEEAAEKSRRICERLLRADWYPCCRTIYGYYPLGREADCLEFLRQALRDGRQVALPRMWRTDGRLRPSERQGEAGAAAGMDFYLITSLRQVAEGSFHVMEPLPDCAPAGQDAAVVLVPGVVFDRSGARYGYGKGCYDRYFARFPGLCRVGIAYEHQIETYLPRLATDVDMHAVVTERRTYGCTG